jgi:glycosyltransferase involved in cell wall biosynthesis
VGHIQPRKNQNAFIRALDPLAGQRQFRVRFIGGLVAGDPFGEEFRTLVEARPWCEFGGLIDNSALGSELGQAAALALPSVEDNCPMTVLESMACGTPVLAANVGGIPELITPDKTGLLFDPRDAESMRLAVASILDAPGRAAERAAAAKAEAVRRFHPVAVARRHIEIYRELLDAPG